MKDDEVQEKKYRTNSAQEINLRHIRMITSEIGLHSFLTYIQLNLSSSLCKRKEWHNHMRIIVQSINRDNDF